MAGVEFADEAVQVQRRLPDIEQEGAAGTGADNGSRSIDGGVITLVAGAAAVEFAGTNLHFRKSR